MSVKASVIVRSYNRIHALCELLELLLDQDFDSYEVIVVEQSTTREEAKLEQLKVLSQDPKIRLLRYEPLGGPKARNEGVKHASGEILIFVDDDDLPSSDQWIRKHMDAYHDPELVGFTGKHHFEGCTETPYISFLRGFIRRRVLSYSLFKFPYTFAQFDEDILEVEWLHGTNSSIRKEWAMKAGLWDTNVETQDEHSLAFKLRPLMVNNYHLEFRNEPLLIRRRNIEGGMGKRDFSLQREFRNQHHYFKRSVFPYHPGLKKYYPIILILIFMKIAFKLPGGLFRANS